MFEVGDKIFYPMHGACLIKAIEEKELLSEKQLYFILDIPSQKLKIMLAKDKIDQLGVRKVVNGSTIDQVLSEFNHGETDFTINSNLRFRSNMNKMRTGDIHQGAEVIRDLMRISSKKSLPLGDQNMLSNARDFLVSEMILVLEIPLDQANDLLDQAISKDT
ncbi:CarD family transcriptional regulator [Bacillus horti]|nr:CarD family transcriptional regulator [Bacillus horti]